jgi:hypothetical protein
MGGGVDGKVAGVELLIRSLAGAATGGCGGSG